MHNHNNVDNDNTTNNDNDTIITIIIVTIISIIIMLIICFWSGGRGRRRRRPAPRRSPRGGPAWTLLLQYLVRFATNIVITILLDCGYICYIYIYKTFLVRLLRAGPRPGRDCYSI